MIFILACALDGTIGVDGHLPWNIPDEYAYFLRQTRSKRVLCARKTYECIRSENLLDHFEHIYVLTHRPDDVTPRSNVTCVKNTIGTIDTIDTKDLWCIGGTSLYNDIDTLRPTEIYLTRVYCSDECNKNSVKLADSFWHVLRESYTCDAAETKWLWDNGSMQKVECEFLHYE